MSSTATSTSPNASDDLSSCEPYYKDHNNMMGGFIPTRQHHHHQHHSGFVVPMLNSLSQSSSSSSMQLQTSSSVLNTIMIERSYNIIPATTTDTGPCFSQSGASAVDLLLEENGVYRDIFVIPPLESVSSTTTSDHGSIISKSDEAANTGCYLDDINTILNHNCHSSSSSNNDNNSSSENKIGLENSFLEELTLGEWNLDDLMKDVSSFPFLDFSV